MKKLFALLAVVLAVVSCQKDADLDVNVGGEQLVNITVGLPEETRAASGVGALENGVLGTDFELRYILEIYRVDNNGIQYETCQRFEEFTNNKTVVFPVRLVAGEGRNYKIVSWADIVPTISGERTAEGDYDYHYETSYGLDNVRIITGTDNNGDSLWSAMDETRDAYTAEKLISNFNSSSPLDLTLTRPFAKVRVIATDIEDVRKVGVVPTKAEANYLEDMPHKFNAVAKNGVASIEKTASVYPYAYATTVTKYTDNAGEMTLFADYVFVPQSGTAKFSLNVFDAQGRSIKNNAFNTEIFVERNKVTTIKGDVLTTGGNVIVKVEDEFDGETEIKVVDTPEALQEVINNIKDGGSANIELGGNIDLGAIAGILSTRSAATLPLNILDGRTLVLDLNGFTITTPWEDESAQKHYYAFENHGTLTIKDSSENGNGKIVARGNFNYGTMTLESGTIEACDGNGGYGVRNYAGTFEMNGGAVIASNEDGDDRVSGNYDATPIRVDEGATATINNGTITNICNFTSAIENHGTTTIKGGYITSVHSTVANNGTMTIKGDATTIKCEGEYISAHPIYAYGEASVTTIENGNIIGNDKASCYYVAVENNPTVYISGGTFTNAGAAAFTGEGTIVVTGGQFDKDPSSCVDSDYTVEQNDNNYVVVRKPNVAMIGEVGYTSLAKAVAAVEDGGTITLVADVTFDELSRQNSGGTWYEGLYYIGNKNFTIDLGGKTISQNGAVNDYLFLFKNDTDKANTINFINGTLNAGTSAYCALCTSTTSTAKITINLENVNLVGNNSNGAVAKIRGGAELNVKAGTVITGADSYVGIESYGATVNIYEGAEIYQNGTSSYNGCLIGVSGNGVINVYGGKGKGAQGGFIAMTSGGTINVSGGEWIANTDGAYANSNKSVLIAQSASGAKSIVNVTGGTFKGGYNCYGDAIGDAQINIKGGNFNADPASYVVAGYESVEENGAYTVGKPKALADFEAAIAKGGNVTLASDVTLLETIIIKNEVVIDLNGKTVTAPSISAFTVKTDGKLTLKNGNVTAHASVVSAQGGEVVIESGYYTETGDYYSNPSTLRYCVDARDGGKITINGGEFNTTNGMFNVNSGCQIKVNGGKFTSSINNAATRHFAFVGGQLTINDGEFLGKANGAAGGCFFCGAAASGDIQVNGGKFTSLWTSGSVNGIFESYIGGTITVTGGMFNTNRGIANFVVANTDEATKAQYPYIAK